ncbi:MAG: hypothetical protein PHT57_03140, partial [Rhodoferax sp.]|nr:hypothetical protein [Rhodoferax sp.]
FAFAFGFLTTFLLLPMDEAVFRDAGKTDLALGVAAPWGNTTAAGDRAALDNPGWAGATRAGVFAATLALKSGGKSASKT